MTQTVNLVMKTADVPDWLAATVATHQEQATLKGVNLSVDVSQLKLTQQGMDNIPAKFDPVQMARALDNLVLNAIRHAPPGSEVAVRAHRAGTGTDRRFHLAAVDNGLGVPVADRERIFEPFVTGPSDGSGLGLAVAREVAAAHGDRAYVAAPC